MPAKAGKRPILTSPCWNAKGRVINSGKAMDLCGWVNLSHKVRKNWATLKVGRKITFRPGTEVRALVELECVCKLPKHW